MLPAGFEPTISTGERLRTYALERAAAGTGILFYSILFYSILFYSITQMYGYMFQPYELGHPQEVYKIYAAVLVSKSLLACVV